MALRDMVTGSDACTTNDGAGPSNAFAGLANTILGTSSKDQERLKEVCLSSSMLTALEEPASQAFPKKELHLINIVSFTYLQCNADSRLPWTARNFRSAI